MQNIPHERIGRSDWSKQRAADGRNQTVRGKREVEVSEGRPGRGERRFNMTSSLLMGKEGLS